MKSISQFLLQRGSLVVGLFFILSIPFIVSAQTCSGKKFTFVSSNWVVEQESALTSVRFSPDTVEVNSPKGITLWYKQPLAGDFTLSYKACVVMQGGANDRLSDLNCFWMAQDPQNVNNLFARSDWRNGIFSRYYSLKLYYVGFGGNNNTTSRFRKYDGDYEAFQSGKVRPDIIKEYTDADHLLKPNTWYQVRIEMKGNRMTYSLNGKKLFDFTDNTPYRSGYFGYRTVQSHQLITDLQIVQ